MKTTFFITTAIFFSSIASAQQANISSKASSSSTVTATQSGTARRGSIQNSTEVQGKGDFKPEADVENKMASPVAFSAGQDNKNSAGTSLKTSDNASTSESVLEPISVKSSSNSAYKQSVETKENVIAGIDHSVSAQSAGAVSVSQSATNDIQTMAKKSACVKAHSDASVKTKTRPLTVKTSSMISTGAKLGL